ncbi:MAG: thioredoxin domain-containing protein, partial [Alphaproteobacteria bacterium]
MRHISPILRFVLVSLVFSVGNSAFVNAQQSSAEHATIIRTAKLNENLRKIYDGMPEEYQPRTEHFLATGEPTYVNRLISKNSPYLLQHAHNPVDWRAWGPEALLEAKQADLPIFLSIGYSTCHWCHVMERESFENVDIANILNVNYIPIKVDREQRPDIDQIYMTAAQLENGRGGWPLSALLLPDGKPFFTGTYFPPENFQHILLQGSQVWHQQNLQVKLHASDLSRAISSYLNVIEEATELNAEVLQASIQSVLLSHEELEGGFSEAPKFPNEPIQSLLMQIARDGGPLAGEALQAVEHTLDAIQRGGINDQLGGGFHRYSTDNSWLVPHFEKMLYNQAQLGKLYVEAYELTGRADFKRTAKRTFDYVLHEMTSPLGTFYSATDADNLSVHGEMEEGDFFVWSVQELKMLLNEEDFARAHSIFDLSEGGNFEGRNILALDTDVGPDDLQFIDRISPTLLAYRAKRNPPLRDDK